MILIFFLEKMAENNAEEIARKTFETILKDSINLAENIHKHLKKLNEMANENKK